MTNHNIPRVLLICENSGTAFWRVKNPLELMRDLGACELAWLGTQQVPMRDRYWIDRWDIVVFHQCWTDQEVVMARYFKSLGKRIVLSIDDLINGFKIPKFITGGAAYRDKSMTFNIHDMMLIADRIVVTQPTLAAMLSKYYDIQEWKFWCFPNMPSFNWFGRLFNPLYKRDTRRSRGGAHRVGIISSFSHYELGDGEKEQDDLQIVVGAMKILKEKNRDSMTWVIPANGEKKIIDRMTPYGKVESVPMTSIRDYPTMLNKLDLDLVVVPLQKNDFNDCKSNIKLLECAASGLPVFVSRCKAYEGFVEEQFVFDDAKGLSEKLDWEKTWSDSRFQDIIMNNYKKFYESTNDYYGKELNGYWLENNPKLIHEAFFEFDYSDAKKVYPPVLKEVDLSKEVEDDGTQEKEQI